MPSAKQTTTNPREVSDNSLGVSGVDVLKEAFSQSPIYDSAPELADDGTLESELRKHYQKLALDGVVNDGGHAFGEFNRDFAKNGAPDYGDVKTGGEGLPASAWVPNIASPGPGSMNPTDQPAPPEGYGQTPNPQWGVGVGSELSPQKSSERIAGQTLGDYVKGASSKE